MSMKVYTRRQLMAFKLYDAEIEYLESTGTQYINTGIFIGIDERVDCTFSLLTYDYTALLGARVAAGNNMLAIWAYTADKCVRFDFGSSNKGGYVFSIFPDLEQYYTVSKIGRKNFVDGSEIQSNIASSYSPEYPSFVFALNNGGNAAFCGHVRIKQFIISDRMHLIPVRVGNIGYMYDKVAKQLFGNAGTGSFILGPDK